MSGLFKNFQRIISNSAFSNPSNQYLVQYRLACYNPASLFFNSKSRETGLRPGHSYDIFSLALSSYELVKQTQNYDEILSTVSKDTQINSSFANFKTELESEIAKNNNFISDAIRDIVTQLKSGVTNLPAGGATGIVSVLSETNNIPRENAAQIVNQYIAPILIEKASYLSTQNFIDVFVGLTKLGLTSNKQLWDALFNAFNKQTLAWEHLPLQYHGWETNVYEQPENQTSDKGEQEFFASDMEKYWVDLKNGNAFVAQIKRYARCYWRWQRFNVLYPLFFREKRVSYEFDKRDVSSERERLFNALQELEKTFPDKVDGIRKRL